MDITVPVLIAVVLVLVFCVACLRVQVARLQSVNRRRWEQDIDHKLRDPEYDAKAHEGMHP